MEKSNYPVQFNVDYPNSLDKARTFFRFILVIPIYIILALLTSRSNIALSAGSGILFLPTALMIVFRQKYPRWWFDWNFSLLKLSNRISAYLLFLRDEYPSTDEEQAVHLKIAYPNVKKDLNRWMPLVKWLLAIPHYIVISILAIGMLVAIIIAWFSILFTGKYPRGLFDFVVGVLRWSNRIIAYALILTTDKYPPFSLKE